MENFPELQVEIRNMVSLATILERMDAMNLCGGAPDRVGFKMIPAARLAGVISASKARVTSDVNAADTASESGRCSAAVGRPAAMCGTLRAAGHSSKMSVRARGVQRGSGKTLGRDKYGGLRRAAACRGSGDGPREMRLL